MRPRQIHNFRADPLSGYNMLEDGEGRSNLGGQKWTIVAKSLKAAAVSKKPSIPPH